MLKSVIAGLAALTIVGTGLATAQPAPPPDAPRYRPTPEDFAAMNEARIAGLRAGLKLTAEQEKHWPAVEAALRDLAKQRETRINERRAQPRDNANAQRPDAIERLRSGAAAMTTRAAALTKLADAAEPLYKSLDEGQKHRFAMLLRMGQGPAMDGPRGPRWHRRTELAPR